MRTHQRTHLIEANTSSRVAHAKHLAKAAESVVLKTMEDENLAPKKETTFKNEPYLDFFV